MPKHSPGPSCGTRKCYSSKNPSGKRNHCATCHEFFNSDASFDMHRIGEFGVDRRCMTTDEMSGAGMALNKDGYWVTSLYDGPRRGEG